ncbi:hypothetical protein [Thiocapsa roseopersicina]|uniref:Uncharacterized protein n=1 Tax=Thiocapsa roseopersicina TaxID=1058 RepID=A0A1H3B864_THIRO|nr:hypothetical protein [Thiocapsa roseopersicina]SDX37841.1 hypothetical protein SAMN05421783_12333 [Thiocapsa roseopersicina]
MGAGNAQPFQLRRFRADDLAGDAIILPELVRDDLPTSSERLALIGNRAIVVIVVIDGDEGKKCKDTCAVARRYLIVTP